VILTDAAIRNRTTIGVLVLLIVLAGSFSYITLPREGPPDVDIPFVIVSTSYEGVAPEDVESSITIKVENELSGMKGVKEVTSSSAEGISVISIEFEPNMEIEDALQRVRDKVDLAKADLPQEAEEPVIREVSVSEWPIMVVNLTGPISIVRLKEIADRLEEAIEQNIDGVLNVSVIGGREREIRLEIDQDLVAAYGLTVPEILSLVPSENVNISAGGLETPVTKFNVRVPAEFVDPEEVDHLVLAVRDGKPVYLSNVARVRDTFKDRAGFSRLDGVESVSLSIQKRVGANIIPIADAVQALLDEARLQAPRGVEFHVTVDQSGEIRMMVSDLENNIISGLILVVAVLVLFMGWRTSLIVALAIPLSMLISFAVVQLLGLTLNMIVLFGLIMALGMLVDNAIVIVENIYRYTELGYDRVHAAMRGTGEVAWPVITSTATTIAAFAPLLFWPDIMGDFMSYLPMTLIITLSSSLFVAMVINPTVCSLVAKSSRRRQEAAEHREGAFIRAYRRLLHAALDHRFATITCALLLLVGTLMLFGKYNSGMELFPEIDPAVGQVNIRCPQGTNISRTNQLARLAEERVRDAIGPDLKYLVANVGDSGSDESSFSQSAGGPHEAVLRLSFHDFEDRKRPSADALEDVRKVLTDFAGAEVKIDKQEEGPPTGAPVTVRVIGENFATLQEISERARRIVAKVPGVINLRSDFEGARPELTFHVDRRKAMLLGVNTAVVGNFLKTAVFGYKVGIYRQFNDEYDITVRLPEDQRTQIEDLLRLRVPNAAGKAVPLSSLGDFDYAGGFGTIRRLNRKRLITLTADNAEGTNSEKVLKDVQDALAALEVPAGYEVEYAGENEEREKSMAFLTKAFAVAVLLIVMILVMQFNTLAVPAIIMTTVLLSLIGVLVGLLVCRMPFGIIMTGVGVISLAGVVVNNAIVLLDYTRQLQGRGMALIEAAVQAGATRLRPVLLTATTTILGLIPMATGVSLDIHSLSISMRSESSQWWEGMAIAVIFGLGFATILTLIVVPTLYVTLYRIAHWFGLGGLEKPEGAAGPTLEMEDF
jgi:multidrug efflux pump